MERILSGERSRGRRFERFRAVQGVQGSETARRSALDSYKYVGFEDQFRGSREDISARLESYLPFFAGAADVLDIGCGRGEFLELLAGAGIRAEAST